MVQARAARLRPIEACERQLSPKACSTVRFDPGPRPTIEVSAIYRKFAPVAALARFRKSGSKDRMTEGDFTGRKIFLFRNFCGLGCYIRKRAGMTPALSKEAIVRT
jgi:hypothetical protein